MELFCASFLAVLLASTPARAAEPSLAASGVYRPVLPLVDAPFNAQSGYQVPGMAQSLELSRAILEGGDWAIDLGFDALARDWHPALRYGVEIPALAAYGMLNSQVAFGTGWLHEEWHRAVLARRGIGSRNGFYAAPPFSDVVAVDHVTDDALATLKRDHPRDFVRLASAGMEASVMLARTSRNEAFFDRRELYRDIPGLALPLFNVLAYLQGCKGTDFDAMTDRKMSEEGSDMARRDFTGADCLAWMYDLERPEESYAARGAHPSGVGVRRYRKSTDLSSDGRDFLGLARNLSFLNFVSPPMFGLSAFPGPDGLEWTFGLQHMLTDAGQVVQLDLLGRRESMGFQLGYHHFFNGARAFPGVEATVRRIPLSLAGLDLGLDAGVLAWLQPGNGGFRDTTDRPGGALRLGLSTPLTGSTRLFAEGIAKTAGWVAGEVDLDASIQGRAGFRLSL